MTHLLILPMGFYAIFIWSLGILSFLTRKSAIRNGEMSPKYFKLHIGPPLPDRVHVVGRHFDNQFQVPIFFLITCVTFLALGQANRLTLFLAWAFVFSRICHSYIHLGRNHLLMRAAAFAIGMTLVLAMWIQLLYFAYLSNA